MPFRVNDSLRRCVGVRESVCTCVLACSCVFACVCMCVSACVCLSLSVCGYVCDGGACSGIGVQLVHFHNVIVVTRFIEVTFIVRMVAYNKLRSLHCVPSRTAAAHFCEYCSYQLWPTSYASTRLRPSSKSMPSWLILQPQPTPTTHNSPLYLGIALHF